MVINAKLTKRAYQLTNRGYLVQRKVIKFTCFLLLGCVLGCASAPPSKTLPQSEVAVSSIDHPNYRNYVGGDIEVVQSKLRRAKEAVANKGHAIAEQLAQQILLDVEVIKIKTQRMTTEQEVEKLEASITNLHQELQWREPVQLSPLDE